MALIVVSTCVVESLVIVIEERFNTRLSGSDCVRDLLRESVVSLKEKSLRELTTNLELTRVVVEAMIYLLETLEIITSLVVDSIGHIFR